MKYRLSTVKQHKETHDTENAEYELDLYRYEGERFE